MKVGIIGLGRMGLGIAVRLQKAGFQIIGYDPSAQAQAEAHKENISLSPSLESLGSQVSVIWLLVPQGQLIDDILIQLKSVLQKNTILIDAGNSKYTDSQRRAQEMASAGFYFIDCGTSGGVHGKEQGYSLMLGGDKKIYEQLIPQWKAIAAPQGYAYMGPSGAGHFVKMVHNGIEYGLLQAYAEGFQLLKEGPFKDLNVTEIAQVWNHGAIIRSWILELTQEIVKKQPAWESISGAIKENGTGAWTVETAQQYKIPVPVIEKSLEVRAWSRKTGGNFATKLIALLRNAFGGHPYDHT